MDDSLRFIGPIGIREFKFNKICESNEGHEHNYDHTTIVINGSIKVLYSYNDGDKLVSGESQTYHQGEAICIKANVRHTVKALEENTVYYCIFSHRDMNGLITQKYIGHDKSYG